jgi:Nif-specific regulatory protein
MEFMLSYAWPGNVRELENCVVRACVIGRQTWITREDLFLDSGMNTMPAEAGSRELKTAINVFKIQFIQRVLDEHNWNQTETAKVLDIQRTYLSRLIRDLALTNPKEIPTKPSKRRGKEK